MMLLVYRSGLIRVTDKFPLGVWPGDGRNCFVLYREYDHGIFRSASFPSIAGATPLGIGISVVIVIVAALTWSGF